MTSNDLIVATKFTQNVIMLRHGDRIDNFDPSWVKTAERPYDPPLIQAGHDRAYKTGLELRNSLGFPIHRIFVSPFLRCVETTLEVIKALDSKVKVSIEYGLCEMLNDSAIRAEAAPKNGEFYFNISEREAMLPAESFDTSVEKIYSEMPKWGETVPAARARYVHIIQSLADKYPSENLLLITHGEGVRVCAARLSTYLQDSDVYNVDYCAYAHVRRSINFAENGSFTSESFQMLTIPNVTGIDFPAQSSSADGV